VDAVHRRRLRARKPLWRAAGDRVAQAFLWCGAAHGDPDRARRLAQAMLAPPSAMHVPLRTATAEDGTPLHLRASCCLYHRVPGAEVCAGCPLRRSPRLRAAAAPHTAALRAGDLDLQARALARRALDGERAVERRDAVREAAQP
jgi:hypothetical protein